MGIYFPRRQLNIKFKFDYRSTNWFHLFNDIPTYRVACPLQLRLSLLHMNSVGSRPFGEGVVDSLLYWISSVS